MDEEIGEKVRLRRVALGLDQSYVAEKLGITLAEFQECEAGRRRFSAKLLIDQSAVIILFQGHSRGDDQLNSQASARFGLCAP
jgi:transcriptional regulator with XRE-family HTH domain